MGQKMKTATGANIGAGTISAVDEPTNSNKNINESLWKSGQSYREPGAYASDASFVFVKNPTVFELRESYKMLTAEVGGNLAPLSVVQSVYDHNPVSWWTIHQSTNASRANATAIGFCAYLPLTEQGLVALKAGAFDTRDPDLELLAPRREDPAALYLWAIVAHGRSDIAGKLIGHAIGLDLYETLPMFGTIATEAGLEALRRSSKSATAAAELKIGAPFEIKLPPKHIAHQRAMEVYEGDVPKRFPERQLSLASDL
jgi:hypothetical protein